MCVSLFIWYNSLQIIPEYANKLNSGQEKWSVEGMHFMGINVRHMGRLRRLVNPHIKMDLMTNMVRTRVLNFVLFYSLNSLLFAPSLLSLCALSLSLSLWVSSAHWVCACICSLYPLCLDWFSSLLLFSSSLFPKVLTLPRPLWLSSLSMLLPFLYFLAAQCIFGLYNVNVIPKKVARVCKNYIRAKMREAVRQRAMVNVALAKNVP